MNRLLNSVAARAAAFVLTVALLMTLCAGLVGVAALYSVDAYRIDAVDARDEMLSTWCWEQGYDVLADFVTQEDVDAISTDSAYVYTIHDKNGDEVYSTYSGQKTQYTMASLRMSYVIERQSDMERGLIVQNGNGAKGYVWSERVKDVPYDDTAAQEITTSDVTDTAAEGSAADAADTPARYDTELVPYTITGYVLAAVPETSELHITLSLFDALYTMRYELLTAAVVSGALALALFAFLMAAAGRRAPEGAVTPTWVEKIPFDLFTAIMATAVVMCLGFGVSLGDNVSAAGFNAVTLTLIGLLIMGGVVLALWWCMSFAVRIKLHTAIKGTLCYKLLAWLWRIVRRVWGAVSSVCRSIPLMPKTVLIMLGILAAEFFWMLITQYSLGMELFGWFIERLVLCGGIIYLLAGAKKLLSAGHEIAAGNVDHRVDTAKLRGPLREHGEDLNSITDGMNKAIADRVKSERFRTELITNVSHDIKTPLTSIVNYVDLMEKEEIDNEKVREYLDVLSRQSARLKKLIDDLMEASKAATGNLNVNFERCELGVMLTQTAGEYEDKLKKAGLELVVTKPEEAVYIMADRRHLWRIFDNLMNNICKYAMPGTRVYLDLTRVSRLSGDALRPGAAVTFRNISKSRLNVSEEELMERFVRGDSSRNTEGSGLGLSIANSLTQLQKGVMTLVVDGDLFKVQLSFDTVE